MSAKDSAEDLVLMLNMGFSLQEISEHSGIPVRTVELMIVSQVQRDRITLKLAAFSALQG